jgi:hypothetical protein
VSELKLITARIHAGSWEGEFSAPANLEVQPDLHVSHLGKKLEGLHIERSPQGDENWTFHFDVPMSALSEGVQTFVLSNAQDHGTVASMSLIAGEVLAEDIRSEVDLLRAELEMLKTAFRRHCVETASD